MAADDRGDGSVERALRPDSEEGEAERIEIECVDDDDSYIVNVTFKQSEAEKDKPWDKRKEAKHVKRTFPNEEETLAYIKEVL
jgi:hypothetical protein